MGSGSITPLIGAPPDHLSEAHLQILLLWGDTNGTIGKGLGHVHFVSRSMERNYSLDLIQMKKPGPLATTHCQSL